MSQLAGCAVRHGKKKDECMCVCVCYFPEHVKSQAREGRHDTSAFSAPRLPLRGFALPLAISQRPDGGKKILMAKSRGTRDERVGKWKGGVVF